MRLIDADALIETMRENAEGNEGWYGDTWAFMRDVESAPTIDAVPRADYEELERHFVNWEPVVRCKDCVSFHYSGMGGDDGITYCAKGIEMQPTDFCSYGERKDNDGQR